MGEYSELQELKYSYEEMMDARISGWDDCKKLVIEVIKKYEYHSELNKHIMRLLMEEIESKDFGIINIETKNKL